MTRFAGSIRRRLRSRRGMSSALIIMLLVLLIFFGVLSLVTTAADLRLAQKRADWNREYYLADTYAVELVAGIENYCDTLDQDSLQAGKLDGLLDVWMTGAANVQKYQISRDETAEAPLLLAALVSQNADKGQGIELQISIAVGQAGQKNVQVAIKSWTQWQPEFNYDNIDGGIWKG